MLEQTNSTPKKCAEKDLKKRFGKKMRKISLKLGFDFLRIGGEMVKNCSAKNKMPKAKIVERIID